MVTRPSIPSEAPSTSSCRGGAIVSEWMRGIEKVEREEERRRRMQQQQQKYHRQNSDDLGPELQALTPEERAKILEVMRRDTLLQMHNEMKVR